MKLREGQCCKCLSMGYCYFPKGCGREPEKGNMKVYEVWERDGTSLGGLPWQVGTFDTPEKAEACVADLRNDWHSRSVKTVEVQ